MEFQELALSHGGEFPPQEHVREWLEKMCAALHLMSDSQLEEANVICPPAVKARLLLGDLGFVSSYKNSEDLDRLDDIWQWSLLGLLMGDRVCLLCH